MDRRSRRRTGRSVADLDNTTKLKLESILDMGGGYVLDLSNATFGDFVRTSIGLDPYEKYGTDLSKAKLLRLIWEHESNPSVAKLNLDLLEYMRRLLPRGRVVLQARSREVERDHGSREGVRCIQ